MGGEHSTLHHHDAKKNPPAAYDEYVRQQKAKVKEVKNNLGKWLRKEDGEFQKKVSDEKKRIERRSRRENQPQDIDWSDSMKYLFDEDRHQKEKQKQEASDRLARKNSWDANKTDHLPRKNSLVRRYSFDGNGRDSDLSAEFEAQQAEEARKVKEVKNTLGKWLRKEDGEAQDWYDSMNYLFDEERPQTEKQAEEEARKDAETQEWYDSMNYLFDEKRHKREKYAKIAK